MKSLTITCVCICYCVVQQAVFAQPSSNTATSDNASAKVFGSREYASSWITALSGQQTTDNHKVLFVLDGVRFNIPRNYFYYEPKPGYRGGLLMRVTYPGFMPLSEKTDYCLNRQKLNEHMSCFPIEIALDPNSPYVGTSLQAFQRSKTIESPFASKVSLPGFESYHVGPPNDGSDFFMSLDIDEKVAVSCINYPKSGGREGVCDDDFILPDGLRIRVRLHETQLEHLRDIQLGTVSLINSFEQRIN